MKWIIIPWGLAVFLLVVFWIALDNWTDALIGSAFYFTISAIVTLRVLAKRRAWNDTFRTQTALREAVLESEAADLLEAANLNREPR